MASEKKMNDSTSFHQSDAPILCTNDCGFFGTAATMNLCSKCYRDSKMREEQVATVIAAVEKSMTSVPPLSLSPLKAGFVNVKDRGEECVFVVLAGSSSTEKAANLCGNCNRKVGVMGFKCRCGSTFCGSHRYPEEHACKFDFKGAAKDALSKANPVVKAVRNGDSAQSNKEYDELNTNSANTNKIH